MARNVVRNLEEEKNDESGSSSEGGDTSEKDTDSEGEESHVMTPGLVIDQFYQSIWSEQTRGSTKFLMGENKSVFNRHTIMVFHQLFLTVS